MFLSCNSNNNNDATVKLENDTIIDTTTFVDNYLIFDNLFKEKKLPVIIDSSFISDEIEVEREENRTIYPNIDTNLIKSVFINDTINVITYDEIRYLQFKALYKIIDNKYICYFIYKHGGAGGWDSHVDCYIFNRNYQFISAFDISDYQADQSFTSITNAFIDTNYYITKIDSLYIYDDDENCTEIYIDTMYLLVDSLGFFVAQDRYTNKYKFWEDLSPQTKDSILNLPHTYSDTKKYYYNKFTITNNQRTFDLLDTLVYRRNSPLPLSLKLFIFNDIIDNVDTTMDLVMGNYAFSMILGDRGMVLKYLSNNSAIAKKYANKIAKYFYDLKNSDSLWYRKSFNYLETHIVKYEYILPHSFKKQFIGDIKNTIKLIEARGIDK